MTALSNVVCEYLQMLVGFPVRAACMAGAEIPEGLTLEDALAPAGPVDVSIVPVKGGRLRAVLRDREVYAHAAGGEILVLAFERKSDAMMFTAWLAQGGTA